MNKIKCIIIDDEELARELLISYVVKIDFFEMAGSFKNALDALNFLNENPVDLMFLDIQMPDITGVNFLKTLKTKPVVIFTTAYKNYALEGYQLDVIDYMLKPINFDRFLAGVTKAIDFIKLKKLPEFSHNNLNKDNTEEHITIKANNRIYRVKTEQVLFIEGMKEYVRFHLTTQKLICLETLKQLEQSLPKIFTRVHKSYIINSSKIEALNGNLIEIAEYKIPIGKTYMASIKAKFFE